LSPGAIALLALAAFGAGFVDAIAGGGGLITVPALMAVGLDPHLALGTNKGQASFGAVASAVGFWRKDGLDRHRALPAFLFGAIGAVLGALAQLAIDPKPLKPIVLGLLVGAAMLIAVSPKPKKHGHASSSVLAIIALVMGAYDGFFGPGTGSLLILAFVTFAGDSMTRASGNAKIVNLASNVASLVTFAIRGTIVWNIALPMAAANAVGAWVGAHVAVARGDKLVRAILIAVVALLIAKVSWDLLR
jgi:uncharacterized membrane protein YfcA